MKGFSKHHSDCENSRFFICFFDVFKLIFVY